MKYVVLWGPHDTFMWNLLGTFCENFMKMIALCLTWPATEALTVLAHRADTCRKSETYNDEQDPVNR